jgi:hypothetical protein
VTARGEHALPPLRSALPRRLVAAVARPLSARDCRAGSVAVFGAERPLSQTPRSRFGPLAFPADEQPEAGQENAYEQIVVPARWRALMAVKRLGRLAPMRYSARRHAASTQTRLYRASGTRSPAAPRPDCLHLRPNRSPPLQ